MKDPVIELLYVLMRDHVPTGVIAGIMKDIEKGKGNKAVYTNTHLADYAASLADRLEQAA